MSWEEVGQWAAGVAVIVLLAAVAWSDATTGTLPPITKAQKAECAKRGEIAVYHGDNKVHCDPRPEPAEFEP